MSRGFLYAFLRINSYKCYYFFSFKNLICHEFGHGIEVTKRLVCKGGSLVGYGVAVDIDQNVWCRPSASFHDVGIGQSVGVKRRDAVMTSRMEAVDLFQSNTPLHTPKVVTDLIWVILCNVALLSNFLNHKVREFNTPRRFCGFRNV